jgi:3-phytase
MTGTRRTFLTCLLACGAGLPGLPASAAVTVEQTYEAPGSADQDDLCFWLHPSDPDLSTVITSDKTSGHVRVYDLAGNVLQSIATPMPGNIDVRYGVTLGGQCVDVVAFNERIEQRIRAYRVDPATRLLVRVDDGAIATGPNYGFALARRADGALSAFTGPDGASIVVREFALVDGGTGELSGSPTGWEFAASTVEGTVADEEAGWVYLGEEDAGIWRVALDDDGDRTLVAAVGGPSGLAADVEGLAVYRLDGEHGYLIASSQSTNTFEVFDREPPHAPLADFDIVGVGLTDGIDVLNVALGASYPQGVFAFHNGEACCPVQAARWEAIADEAGLVASPSGWHPRRSCGPRLAVSRTELAWTPSSPATGYDVVRGDLQRLRASGGEFAGATTGCLADDSTPISVDYAARPVPGAGEWYLVRGVAAFGPLSYDSYGPAQSAPRDGEIAASALACP